VLERGIALALIDTGGGAADVVDGDDLVLDVRGRHLSARISALPFVPAGKRTDPVGGGH
jgi:glycine cleavage system aminomethyltransferase T